MLGKSGFDEGMENLSEYIILIYFYGDTQGAKLHGKIFFVGLSNMLDSEL